MSPVVQFPVLRTWLRDRALLEIEIRLDIQVNAATWHRQNFLFDTGTQLTTIPIALAQKIGIEVPTNRPARIQGTTGVAKGLLGFMRFSLVGLEDLKFQSLVSFNERDLKRPLLSLTDILSHFSLRIRESFRLHPLGTLELHLRNDHGDLPRSS